MRYEDDVLGFLRSARELGLRYLMVGGGAVNFHGYQRNSADVDLWIEPTPENFDRLKQVLASMGYESELPPSVLSAEQNVSIKISSEQELELITSFNPGCSFEEAFARAVEASIAGEPVTRIRVLAFDDLVNSKIKSARPKDLLDVDELQRRREGTA
ncbi:MAG: hypothetical protein KIT10_12145 [Flavobacteriales bacterium]|nr:hypothetical protein [Flavobacteriales bacterium]